MTIELQPFLKRMITAPGISGNEGPIQRILEEVWQPLSDQMELSRVGSLHALRRGFLPEPRPSLLLAAHMDAIGMMVTTRVGEFLHFTQVGGLDERVLPGQVVTVHGRHDLPGLIVQPPAHLLPPDQRSGPVLIEHLLVDTGLTEEELNRLVRPGDLISYAQTPLDMRGDTLAGHSLDNRASLAALTYCLELLKDKPPAWDVWAAATVQEEVSFAGASTSAYNLRPSVAIAIDVTHASSPGAPSHRTFPMGKGITLGFGPNIHPALFKKVKSLADRLEIPHKVEVMPRHSGTDAYALQIVAEGIPTMVVSIPLRYMHTPVEIVSMKDITRVGRLLAEFSASLDSEFMNSIQWDD